MSDCSTSLRNKRQTCAHADVVQESWEKRQRQRKQDKPYESVRIQTQHELTKKIFSLVDGSFAPASANKVIVFIRMQRLLRAQMLHKVVLDILLKEILENLEQTYCVRVRVVWDEF